MRQFTSARAEPAAHHRASPSARDGRRDRVRDACGWTADSSALRRRFTRAQAATRVRPLRWHDLRHTYGSLLAANGVDLVTIQSAIGHSALATTGRYLHARPASDEAARFTRAFDPGGAPEEVARVAKGPTRPSGHVALIAGHLDGDADRRQSGQTNGWVLAPGLASQERCTGCGTSAAPPPGRHRVEVSPPHW